ncbi:hypothetical protein V8C34DRAFT_152947 [Trichoderma compactum]
MRFPAKEGLLVALSASGVRAVNNGLARTPQMGWNNWNTFACSVSSTLVSFNRFNEMAKALKKTGRSILYSLCSWGEDHVHTASLSPSRLAEQTANHHRPRHVRLARRRLHHGRRGHAPRRSSKTGPSTTCGVRARVAAALAWARMGSHDAQALLDAKDADARRSLLQTRPSSAGTTRRSSPMPRA